MQPSVCIARDQPMARLDQPFDRNDAVILLLLLLILAITDSDNQPLAPGLQAILIGLIVVAIGISWGGMHGYAINPARDFGPRLFTLAAGFKDTGFENNVFWVPIIGPLLGGLLGALVYDGLIRPFLPRGHAEKE